VSVHLGAEYIPHELFLSIIKLSFNPATSFIIFVLFRFSSHSPDESSKVKLYLEPAHLFDQLANDKDLLLFKLITDHLDMLPLANLKVPHLNLHLRSLDIDVVALGGVPPLSEVVPLDQVEAVFLQLLVFLKVFLVTAVLDTLV
jgi:hypothetical protein